MPVTLTVQNLDPNAITLEIVRFPAPSEGDASAVEERVEVASGATSAPVTIESGRYLRLAHTPVE